MNNIDMQVVPRSKHTLASLEETSQLMLHRKIIVVF